MRPLPDCAAAPELPVGPCSCFHWRGRFIRPRMGFCTLFQCHDGQTFSMDLWAETAPCLKGVLFLPGCIAVSIRSYTIDHQDPTDCPYPGWHEPRTTDDRRYAQSTCTPPRGSLRSAEGRRILGHNGERFFALHAHG